MQASPRTRTRKHPSLRTGYWPARRTLRQAWRRRRRTTWPCSGFHRRQLPEIARLAIEAAARAMEARLRYRGRLIYVGAGTSGRLAVQDGAELMPTFSWPSERLLLIMAGGAPAFTRSIEGAEDQ